MAPGQRYGVDRRMENTHIFVLIRVADFAGTSCDYQTHTVDTRSPTATACELMHHISLRYMYLVIQYLTARLRENLPRDIPTYSVNRLCPERHFHVVKKITDHQSDLYKTALCICQTRHTIFFVS